MARQPRRGAPAVADLARTTFGVLFIVGLLGTSIWILRPFLGPTVWATMVVVATWPLMLRIQQRLWGKRSLAVVAMTLMLLLLFLVPLSLAVVTIVGNADQIVAWAKVAASYRLPDEPPLWASRLPMVGSLIVSVWEQATAHGLSDLLPRLSPYAGNLTRWFVGEVGSIGFLLVQFLVTLVIAAVMYASGEQAADLVRGFARRLAGQRGVGAVELAGGAIRGVALGVGVTAAVQAALGGVGVAVAGVPFPGLLTALMFMLCVAQVGPAPVLVPAVIWIFWDGHTGWAVALAIWATIVSTLDNVIRPLLIRLGADLPLMLIFAGVIGGLLGFGLVGIFVGPVVLAVAYTLLEAWMGDLELPAPPAPPPGPPPPVAAIEPRSKHPAAEAPEQR